jgi:hypothetical protein
LRRYRTALSSSDVLLFAAPAFVAALSLAFEVDLALEVCESSDFALDFLPAALEEGKTRAQRRHSRRASGSRYSSPQSTNRLCSPPNALTTRSASSPAGRPHLIDSGWTRASSLVAVRGPSLSSRRNASRAGAWTRRSDARSARGAVGAARVARRKVVRCR